MNAIYSIVTPTILQATRLENGRYSAGVSIENHAPSHAFISLEDYVNHDLAGLITIESVKYHNDFGTCTVVYSVN